MMSFQTPNLKSYSELIKFDTFEDRFKYLKLNGQVGSETYGFDDYIRARFYTSVEWRRIRDSVILRDMGCDLGIEGMEIGSYIFIHHMNPIYVSDINDVTDILLNPEYLICVSRDTHNALHYGNLNYLNGKKIVERAPNDMCPWKL